jgi:hypothetical protein
MIDDEGYLIVFDCKSRRRTPKKPSGKPLKR